MKICIITTSYPAHRGHPQSPFIHFLASSLAKNNQKVSVVCPYYRDSKKRFEIWDGVKIYRFQYFVPKSLQILTSGGGIPSMLKSSLLAKIQFPFYLLSMFLKSRKVAKNCDIIHAQWALAGLIGVFLKKIYKKPLILTTRGAALNSALKGKLSKKILMYTLKNCDYITPNNFAHEKVVRNLGLKKVKTIPNGVAIGLFKPGSRVKARKELGLPLKAKIVFCNGWLIPRKGYNYLFDALPALTRKYKDLLVIVLGEGILKPKLVEQLKRLKMEKYVSFIKQRPLSQVPIWMNSADIFILPSLSEGRPNVVPEALAAGVPVIATKVSGTPEFIDHNKNGLLIKPKNPEAIEKAIDLLLSDKKLYKKLVSNCRKSVLEKKLSWDNCAKDYLKIYKSVK